MTSPGRGTPRRVRVTSPRSSARRVDLTDRTSRYADLDEETALGEVYVDSILRAQRRLALSLVALVSLLVLGLPAGLLVLPTTLDLGVISIPAAWLGLGALVYPVLLLMTFWYVRAAERVEREFLDLMELP